LKINSDVYVTHTTTQKKRITISCKGPVISTPLSLGLFHAIFGSFFLLFLLPPPPPPPSSSLFLSFEVDFAIYFEIIQWLG